MTRQEINYDVAVIGGGLGGVGAALSACAEGASVALTEQTDWLGGQLTSQGVSAPDENPYIEDFSGTTRYENLRTRIREHYRENRDSSGDSDHCNPGNCWVSNLGFEPEVGVRAIEEFLEPHRETGNLEVFLDHRPVAATVPDDRIESVTLSGPNGPTEIRAHQFLDATELGALLSLSDTPYVTGAESREMTGEPDARSEYHPEEVQSFTYTFAVEHRPGENHVIDPPEDYDRLKVTQPYSFEYEGHTGVSATYRMFTEGPNGERPFWSYRRLLDAEQFDDVERDVSMINWSSNDFYGATLVDKSYDRRREILERAKRLSLGFLHWLQTEAPCDDGDGSGYPGLKLLPDVMGTDDGFSKYPYIRESRRIIPEKRVVQTDVTARANTGARARTFDDSVGIGHYGIDIHQCVGDEHGGIFESTLPFQVPMGALIPADGARNLLAACKNIGVTHVTNGCYRLHPIEWNIGESAGVLAARCAREDTMPAAVYADDSSRHAYQYSLVSDHGIPIAWTTDVGPGAGIFGPTQLLYAKAAIRPGSERYDRLEVLPDTALTTRDLRGTVETICDLLDREARVPTSTALDGIADREAVEVAFSAAGLHTTDLSATPTWREVCQLLSPVLETLFR